MQLQENAHDNVLTLHSTNRADDAQSILTEIIMLRIKLKEMEKRVNKYRTLLGLQPGQGCEEVIEHLLQQDRIVRALRHKI